MLCAYMKKVELKGGVCVKLLGSNFSIRPIHISSHAKNFKNKSLIPVCLSNFVLNPTFYYICSNIILFVVRSSIWL